MTLDFAERRILSSKRHFPFPRKSLANPASSRAIVNGEINSGKSVDTLNGAGYPQAAEEAPSLVILNEVKTLSSL